MTVSGGLRSRLIRESIYQEVNRILSERGWLTYGVTFVPEPLDNNEQITLNTLALSEEGEYLGDAELGSTLTTSTTSFYLDFYGANQSIASDVTGDLAAALRGRLPEVGREHGKFDVYDYRQENPPHLFSVDVTRVRRDRTVNPTRSWLKHWHMVWFDVEDEY